MAKLSDDRLDKFKPQTRNANKHTQRGMGTLETSMRKYGYVSPMTAAADGEIIDGSARIETSANVFGDDVIVVHHDGTKPVIMVRDDIPSADTPEARAISIAANRVASLNLDFDAEVLFEDLQAGIDLGDLWRKDELADLFADLLPKTTGDTPAEVDRAEELREKWGVRSGDLWLLDSGKGHPHKLICGDCTDPATVARVMAGELVDCIVTDPPYGVDYDGGTTVREKLKGDDSPQLYLPALKCWLPLCAPHVAMYLWYADGDQAVAQAVAQAGWQVRRNLIWCKNQAQFGALSQQYHQKHEPFLYCHIKGKSPFWAGDATEVTVWDVDRESVNDLHPTQKPPALFERAIRNSSKVGAVVFDGFSGSGTTIIACENLHRRARACEISPAYVAVALQRFADHTNVAPVLLEAAG